jgi:hypothetical protein
MSIQSFRPGRKDNEVWAPIKLLKCPQIRHRNSESKGLSSTAFQLAIIVWDQARANWLTNVNKQAWEAGPEGGAEQREREAAFIRGKVPTAIVEREPRKLTRAQILKDYKQGKVPDETGPDQFKLKRTDRIKLAYQEANYHTRQHLLERGPSQADLIYTISKYAMMKVMGRANSVKNRNKVIPALGELLQPIGDQPPILLGYRETPAGIELKVNPKWFEGEKKDRSAPYVTLRTPFPDKSHILWLYAWLHSIRTDSNNYRNEKDRINVTFLYKAMGIYTADGPVMAAKFFERCVDGLNKHIQGVQNQPAAFEVQTNADDVSNSVRFIRKKVQLIPKQEQKMIAPPKPEKPVIVEPAPAPQPEAVKPAPCINDADRAWLTDPERKKQYAAKVAELAEKRELEEFKKRERVQNSLIYMGLADDGGYSEWGTQSRG